MDTYMDTQNAKTPVFTGVFIGSWRCTASFFIEPSWKQASAWFYEKSRAPFGVRLFVCEPYWIRTSDLCPVKAAL